MSVCVVNMKSINIGKLIWKSGQLNERPELCQITLMGLIKNLHTRNRFVFSPLKEHYITEIGSSEPPKKRIQVFLPSRVIAPLMGAARVGWLVVPGCTALPPRCCCCQLNRPLHFQPFNEPPPLRRCQEPTIFSALKPTFDLWVQIQEIATLIC